MLDPDCSNIREFLICMMAAGRRFSMLPARKAAVVLVLCSLSLFAEGCTGFDLFLVSDDVPDTPATPMPLERVFVPEGPVTGTTYLDEPCGKRSLPGGDWFISDVIRSALCRDPRSRRSWAEVAAASARLGAQYSQFLPSLSNTSTFEEGHTQRSVPSRTFLNEGNHLSRKITDVGLSWVLFDGGVRMANAAAAENYLLAKNASHNRELLAVFSDAAQAYFRAVALQATVDAKREAERTAQNAYRVSSGRHRGGIAPLSDVLQAETAFHQASLNRMDAEGRLVVVRGQLATLVGMPANAEFSLHQPKFLAPTSNDIGSAEELIQEAERRHPSIVAAAAQLSARRAESKAAALGQLPTVSFTTDFTGSIRTGEIGLPQKSRYAEGTIGIKIKIPLSVVENSYGRREAAANVAAAQADFDDAQLKVAQDVWTSYQQLKTDLARYEAVSKLLAASERSYAIANGRYQQGVGSILELLNAQTALANAQQEQIEVQSSYCSDRLVLSANLGKLDLPERDN